MAFRQMMTANPKDATEHERDAADHADHKEDYAWLPQGLNRRLWVKVLLASLCSILLAYMILAPTYRRFTLARQNLYDILDYRELLDAANHFASERVPSVIALSMGSSLDDETKIRLASLREKSDKALTALTAPVSHGFGLDRDTVPSDMLANVRQRLTLARTRIDRLIQLSPQTLKREEYQEAIESMFEVNDSFRQIVLWRANVLVRKNSELVFPVLLGAMLSDLRDYGGRIASQIIAPIVTKERQPVENIIDSRQTEGRLLGLWQAINGPGAIYDTPALASLREEIEKRFFGEGRNLLDRVIREGRSTGTYFLTVSELVSSFVPNLRPIETYRIAVLDATIRTYAEASAAALVRLVTVSIITLLIIGLLIALILSLRTQIFEPLQHAQQEVRNLAQGALASSQTRPEGVADVFGLFSAIDELENKIRERASITKELQTLAETDGLTGLLNRGALDRITQAEANPVEAGKDICLILMDVDRFKTINDSYGHPTGDRVLVQIAQLMQEILRPRDILARFGGEEFAVVLAGKDLCRSLRIARRIRLAFQNEIFLTTEDHPLRVTASFGVACGQYGRDTWPLLVERADRALYRAKSAGRNRVRLERDRAKISTER